MAGVITKRIRGKISKDGTYYLQLERSVLVMSFTFVSVLVRDDFCFEFRSPNRFLRWKWYSVWMRSTEPVIFGENLPMPVSLPTGAEMYVSGAVPGSPIEFEMDLAD
jgi:hypothetical protein